MVAYLKSDWKSILQEEFKKPYFKNLEYFVEEEYALHTCFPERKDIFNAFNLCPFAKVKVVIIGQDPYPNKGQANGLSFSVNTGVKHPASLQNIFKELENDVQKPYPISGNLKHWSAQGVLLLNTILTVREKAAGSHKNKGWEIFTDAVIKKISATKKNIVFLLWGNYAQKKETYIDTSKHYCIKTGHPSPLSANRGYWFNTKSFSTTNYLLQQNQHLPISW